MARCIVLRSFLSEQGEVDAAVAAVIQEPGVVGEVVVLAMLENEDAVLVQEISAQDQVGNLRQFLQSVRRVGKDEVELLVATLQKTEHVATNQDIPVFVQLLEALADEVGVVTVGLHADHLLAATRHQFERDASRASEKVEGCGILKIYISLEHIENVLLGKIGSRTCLECTRYVEVTSFILSCNDSHFFIMLNVEC